ncbi:maleylpyruvate isomerase family mycothiol-dependent enzyme [Nocardia sp. NPDC088792]|uniref:maleylpyruvate isomerase family mycothiol-dependent enzyme n=1 Tax=Nocardia sp. NPDC088792 TaxID=3364332 RepID=UPI00382AFBF1
MTVEELREQTFAERARLVEVLGGLTGEQWHADSLCAGWRVAEVVAHITLQYRTGAAAFFAGFARAGFSFDRYADRAARRDAGRFSEGELLQSLADNVRTPWNPPGGGPAGALSHDVVHGLDITEPLGLASAPAERIALVLANSTPKNLAFFGADFSGIEFRAEDADVRVGSGRVVTLPAKDILLIVTGRKPVPRG